MLPVRSRSAEQLDAGSLELLDSGGEVVDGESNTGPVEK
jgi:hypothetical protein